MEVVEGGSSLSLTGLETDKKVMPAWVQKQVGDLCTLKINCVKEYTHSKKGLEPGLFLRGPMIS